MRVIHTADWHLGRVFYGVHLTDDQAYVLDQFMAVLKETRPDAVLIAGDLYDRAVPPPEAVSLLDEALNRMALDFRLPVIAILGNHDSPQRQAFGSRFFRERGLYLYSNCQAQPEPVRICDQAGLEVDVYPVPYAEPAVVRDRLQIENIFDHHSAMEAQLQRIRACQDPKRPSVLMGHAFVTGGLDCESERPLSVGGAGTVDASCFNGFSYVALGHLHRPQAIGGEHIQYSGSLMKYSFSEADHRKAVSLVEIDSMGQCRVERIPLTAKRDLRCVEGHMADLLQGPRSGENAQDYLLVRLLDETPILDAMGKLRQVYPNVMHLERPMFAVDPTQLNPIADHRKMQEMDLFAAFYKEMTGAELSVPVAEAFQQLVQDMDAAGREVSV